MDDATKKTCPICGKEFFVLDCDQWVYKRQRYGGGGYDYFNRYSCWMEDERRHMKPSKPIPLEEADKVPGVRREPMASRALLEKVLELLEKDGHKAALAYLEALGYAGWKKWHNLKKWAETHDPEMYKRMPERLSDRRRKEERDESAADDHD